jgi:hypothetical protein
MPAPCARCPGTDACGNALALVKLTLVDAALARFGSRHFPGTGARGNALALVKLPLVDAALTRLRIGRNGKAGCHQYCQCTESCLVHDCLHTVGLCRRMPPRPTPHRSVAPIFSGSCKQTVSGNREYVTICCANRGQPGPEPWEDATRAAASASPAICKRLFQNRGL